MLTAAVTLLMAGPVYGQGYVPITDRHYAIDLYRGAAVGSPRMISMGGTGTALGEGAEGMIASPAAVAMRPAGAQGLWDWDGTLDAFVPSLGSDIDNSGNVTPTSTQARMGSAALLGLYGGWGLGASYSALTHTVAAGGRESAEFQSSLGRLALGRVLRDGLVVAVGLRLGSFTVARPRAETLARSNGTSLEAGFLLAEPGEFTRWGARLSLPVHGSDLSASCNPLACDGLILPERAVAPWELSIGVARRLAPTIWNHTPERRFSDERGLILTVDLVFSGAVDNATGVGPFSAGVMQPSGRHLSASLRTGAEYECLPGWVRLRAGTYWEPGRFDGASGRVHGTAGLELRLFSFEFWDVERRVALSFAGDAAHHYGNAGISLGFWH